MTFRNNDGAFVRAPEAGFRHRPHQASEDLDQRDFQQCRAAAGRLGSSGRATKAPAEGRQDERGRRGRARQLLKVSF